MTDAEIEPAPNLGFIWTAPTLFSIKSKGYERKEFFFSGTANAYQSARALSDDGHWQVTPSGDTADYKSRMVVYRPIDPKKFNGTVIVEWMNVSSSVDTPTEWIMLHTELMRKGYAYVGVSAQQVGIEGGPIPLPKLISLCLSVKCVSPLRYASLYHPGDSFSYDIFLQAAQLIRYPQVLNPLGEMKPEIVIAAGQSQSAHRLVTFANAFGKNIEVFDGYFIHSRLGVGLPELGFGSAPLSQAPQQVIHPGEVVQIRNDLNVPVMNLQAETDQLDLKAYLSRQEDSDYFRLWEIAGSAHADIYVSLWGLFDTGDNTQAAKITYSKTPNPVLGSCSSRINTGPQHHFIAKAALEALNNWITKGIAPGKFPRLQLNSTADDFQRDIYGIALGGVRSPYVDVPIASMTGSNHAPREGQGLCYLYGTTDPLPNEILSSLYPTSEDYIASVTSAVYEAINHGTLLPEDAELVLAAAAELNLIK
ncbi:MAG: hypothetical protein MI976_23325 [Pseudomonadales bacterium]|nr:hypothetical protein [Pseudomonadales bacterium]